MANPYHDENGRFCSSQEMMNAILRLHLEGDTAGAAKLMGEYQAATRQEQQQQNHPGSSTRDALLSDWTAQYGHLKEGDSSVAEHLNYRWSAYAERPAIDLNDYIRGVITDIAHGRQTATPDEEHNLPILINYQSEVLPHYPLPDNQKGYVEDSPCRSLAVFSHHNRLYGLVVEESTEKEHWTYHRSVFFPLAQPEQKLVQEETWQADETVEGQKQAQAVYEKHFPADYDLYYAPEETPLSDTEGVPVPVEGFTGRRYLGEELNRAVYLLDGKHYQAERIASSWDDGRGTLDIRFQPVTRKVTNRAILYFPQPGRKTWNMEFPSGPKLSEL